MVAGTKGDSESVAFSSTQPSSPPVSSFPLNLSPSSILSFPLHSHFPSLLSLVPSLGSFPCHSLFYIFLLFITRFLLSSFLLISSLSPALPCILPCFFHYPLFFTFSLVLFIVSLSPFQPTPAPHTVLLVLGPCSGPPRSQWNQPTRPDQTSFRTGLTSTQAAPHWEQVSTLICFKRCALGCLNHL